MDGPDDDGFAVVATHRPDGALEVLVVGDLDLAATPKLVATVRAEVTADPCDVAVVLNAVSFVDSTGLVGLLEMRDAVIETGHRFVLVSPSTAVSYVLELTGLDAQFAIE